MPKYDPQRSRHRQPLPDDEPAPVDALLEPHPAVGDLPTGVEVEVVEGEVVVHTDDADIEISQRGDDIVVHTGNADIEVLAEADEVVVSSATEEIYVDLTDGVGAQPVGPATADRRRLLAVAFVIAAIVAFVIVRRRRRG
jgi:hypothetical protein